MGMLCYGYTITVIDLVLRPHLIANVMPSGPVATQDQTVHDQGDLYDDKETFTMTRREESMADSVAAGREHDEIRL